MRVNKITNEASLSSKVSKTLLDKNKVQLKEIRTFVRTKDKDEKISTIYRQGRDTNQRTSR